MTSTVLKNMTTVHILYTTVLSNVYAFNIYQEIGQVIFPLFFVLFVVQFNSILFVFISHIIQKTLAMKI